MQHCKIKIQNFGPIKKGVVDGEWITINKVTVFTGDQGAGKSTVVKLISTLTWVEKAVIRGELKHDLFNHPGHFEKVCEFHNIQDYFKNDTLIEYRGHVINFLFSNGKASVELISSSDYYFPKILYVPAERYLISAVSKAWELEELSGDLSFFSNEYFNAIENFKGVTELPVDNLSLEIQNLNQAADIVGEEFKIHLPNASSGIQSLVPVYIVSKYLSGIIDLEVGNIHYNKNYENSLMDEYDVNSKVQEILNHPDYTDKVKRIQLLLSKLIYSSFINIVETPEQGLFPISQKKLLNKLIAFNNMKKENRLIMTTNSPYLINYLTLAAKAGSLFKASPTEEIRMEINAIVSENSTIDAEDLSIYELTASDGKIRALKSYKGIPSDDNILNQALGQFNELFAQMLNK